MPEYYNLQLMLDVARDMEKLCPDAWILLAGNPVFARDDIDDAGDGD